MRVTPLLTPREVAAMLRVQPETLNVWRCVKRYPLPYLKIGSRIRYRLADVEKFILSRRA